MAKAAKRSTRKTKAVPAGRRSFAPQASGGSALERLIQQALHGDESQPNVSAKDVRGLPAAWYSINKICGHIGSLPLNLYQRPRDGEARIATEHPAYWLTKKAPSEITGASVWREVMQHHALLHGNGRSYIKRNGRGEPAELIVIRPEAWGVIIRKGATVSGVTIPDQKFHVRLDNPEVYFQDSDCLHIMGLSDDGVAGIGVVEAAKYSLGLAKEQTVRAWSSEKKGVRLKLLLSAPPGAFRDETAARKFIEAFNEYHTDADNTDKAGLLREGISAETISQTNRDAQAIEARTFARQDVGLLFAVEQMLGDDSSVSYNSLEQKNQAYVTNCLMRWLNRWEEECARKLLTEREYRSETWYFKFITAALLRGTTKERYEVYQIARQIETMSANDVRELEDQNKRTDGGGDEYNNPAINPKTTQATTGNQQSQQAATNATQARLARVISARVNGLVNVERSRVEQAAMKDHNFVEWVDEFYANLKDRLTVAIAECEGPPDLAVSWTEESKRRVLEAAGRSDATGLRQSIASETALWTERANQLASAIISWSGNHA